MRRHCDATYLLDEANPSVAGDPMKRLLLRERTLHRSPARGAATRRALHRVESALGRIGLGTWGHCASCGEPIDAARLAAHPEIDTCRACQVH